MKKARHLFAILLIIAVSACELKLFPDEFGPQLGQGRFQQSMRSLSFGPCDNPSAPAIYSGGALGAADVIELEPGKLMAVPCSNPGYTYDVVWYFISNDGGYSWSDYGDSGIANEENIFRDSLSNAIIVTGKATCVNLFKEDSTILAVINVIEPPYLEGGRPQIMRSPNNGKFWRNPVRMVEEPKEIVIQNARNIVKTNSERLIIPIQYTQYGSGGAPATDIGTLYSDDRGDSWHEGIPIFGDNTQGLAEPSVALLDNGQVIMLIRTQKNFIYKSFSDDNGSNWSPPFSIGLPSPWTSSTVKTTEEGFLVALYTHSDAPWGFTECVNCFPRKSINSASSYDGGLSWCNFKTITTIDPSGPINEELVQPSLLFFEDQALITYVYTNNGNTQITHAKAYCRDALLPNYGTIGPGEWQMSSTVAMTSLNDNLYIVSSNNLYEVDSKFGTYTLKGATGAWASTKAITSYTPLASGSELCIVAGNNLYRAYPSNGAYSYVSAGWSTTHAMASIDQFVFIYASNKLYRVEPISGAYTVVVPSATWPNPQGMTTLDGRIYILSNNQIYKVHPFNLQSVQLVGGATWQGAESITSMNGNLYINKSGQHYEVDPTTGSSTVMDGPAIWPSSKLLTSISQKEKLYFLHNAKINFHKID